MSRQGAGTPEFRLRFDYPYLEAERIGAPPQRVLLAPGDPAPALRSFAAEVGRTGGRLTALLPEAEVWRGRVAASDGGEVARRAAAAALGASPREMTITLGPLGVDGLRPAAAVRRDTLREARAFLAHAGLRRARITGVGAFPGFDGPPAFPRIAVPMAPDRTVAAGACGLAAALALMVWLAPWRDDAPTPEALAAAPINVAPATQSAAPPIAPPVETEVALAAPQPRARPDDLAASAPAAGRAELVPVGLASRNAPVDIAPPAAPPAARAAVALETIELPLPRPTPAADAQAAAPTPARPADGSRGPLPRPAALSVAPAQETTGAPTPKPTAALDPVRAPDGPRPRPAAPQAEVLVASLGPDVLASDRSAASAPLALAAADGGPLPRPAGMAQSTAAATAAPVMVAALSPSDAAVTELTAAAAVAPPPRRIAPAAQKPAAAAPAKSKAVAPTKPKAVAAAAPVAVRAQPAPAPAQAAARPKAPVKTQTVRLKQPALSAGPVRTAALTTQPARVQPKAQAQQVRVKRAPAQQASSQAASRQPGLRSNALALVGIFGAANGRHALVQLPNGATERVRAGDQLQGVQVTAIAADGVHLRAQGRETVLRLPD